MIDETLGRIENTISSTEVLTAERKNELLRLIAELKNEIEVLDDIHNDDVGSITSYTEASIREAVKTEQNEELLRHTLDGLKLSVQRFEISHPTLIGIINNIGQVLNNLGI